MMTPEEKKKLFEETKSITGFCEEDVANLISLSPVMKKYGEELSEFFYGRLHRVEATDAILKAKSGRETRLKNTLIVWFNNLFEGNYDLKYASDMIRIGQVHVAEKIDQRYVVSMYGMVFQFIINALQSEYTGQQDKIEALSNSAAKILSIDMAMMMESYLVELLDSTGWSMTLLKKMAAVSISKKLER
ncbi:MAG: protoglobin domain-containing protein [Prochloraceae cyanobacterium]